MSHKPDHCMYKDSTVIMYCVNCPDRFTCYPHAYESKPLVIGASNSDTNQAHHFVKKEAEK